MQTETSVSALQSAWLKKRVEKEKEKRVLPCTRSTAQILKKRTPPFFLDYHFEKAKISWFKILHS